MSLNLYTCSVAFIEIGGRLLDFPVVSNGHGIFQGFANDGTNDIIVIDTKNKVYGWNPVDQFGEPYTQWLPATGLTFQVTNHLGT